MSETAARTAVAASAAIVGAATRPTAAHIDAPTSVKIRNLGRTDYTATWHAMQAFTATREVCTQDEIWLTEHAAIYTLGLAGRREHLLRDNGIEVIKVDRGGQVTYHGPGQLVAYLLFDLKRNGLGVRAMVRHIENAVVEWLAGVKIAAFGKPSAPGVYVATVAGEAKIAALGLKIRNGCTYHGLALNVAMDLAPFVDIDPCGFRGLAVTDLATLGVALTVADAGEQLAPILARHLRSAGTS